MKAFQELTEWPDNTPNHVYFMDDGKSKAYGYVRKGTDTTQKFSRPMKIDTRGRKFREVPNVWQFKIEEETTQAKSWRIEGSKGSVYTVEQSPEGYTCTCQGFRFKGTCKHIAQVTA